MTCLVAKAKKKPFDVKVFLKTVDGGRSISSYRTHQTVFSQGDPADAVFYIQEGKVRLASYPSRARRQSWPSLGAETLSAKVA